MKAELKKQNDIDFISSCRSKERHNKTHINFLVMHSSIEILYLVHEPTNIILQ